MKAPNASEIGGDMNPAETVVGVLLALGFVILVSALAAAYVLWKDGCCKKRQEEDNEGKWLVHGCWNDATF